MPRLRLVSDGESSELVRQGSGDKVVTGATQIGKILGRSASWVHHRIQQEDEHELDDGLVLPVGWYPDGGLVALESDLLLFVRLLVSVRTRRVRRRHRQGKGTRRDSARRAQLAARRKTD